MASIKYRVDKCKDGCQCKHTDSMRVKNGEVTGSPLYSVDGVRWYWSPEEACRVFRLFQEGSFDDTDEATD